MPRRIPNRRLVAAGLVRRLRRTEARPLVDLSDFHPAELSDFGPALTRLGRSGREGTNETCRLSPGPAKRRSLRRVPAGALARALTVLKMIVTETRVDNRVLERTTPIDIRCVTEGAHRIDRPRSWAGPQVRSIDDDVVTARIRECHRRDECPVTEEVREECPPGLGPCSRTTVQIARNGAFRNGDAELQ